MIDNDINNLNLNLLELKQFSKCIDTIINYTFFFRYLFTLNIDIVMKRQMYFLYVVYSSKKYGFYQRRHN